MNRKLLLFLASFLISFTSLATIPQRPNPPKLVNDFAGIFSYQELSQLEHRLVSFDDTTSNQILLVTVPSLDGQDEAVVANEIGEQWGVGDENFNNGIVLLIKPKTNNEDGVVFIAVGYGLEGAIPDAIAKRIVELEMIPPLRENNDYYASVNAALDVLMPLACGEISVNDYYDSEDEGAAALFGFGFFFIIIFIFILGIIGKKGGGSGTNIGSGSNGRKLNLWDIIILSQILGGSNRGSSWGGGSSGGGFGGGFGGGIGGGFGGFGGGHFGGAGAGGHW
ncbi:MAG: TPM domain-containing protein [Bacteroidales bacterium]|nr:TPM domain-containing protein [Bacteroidales bacterium]